MHFSFARINGNVKIIFAIEVIAVSLPKFNLIKTFLFLVPERTFQQAVIKITI